MSQRTPAPQLSALPAQSAEQVRRRWRAGLFALLALAAVALAWLQPVWLVHGAEWIGYGVCHQIPERSLTLLGQPSPLCARCTGTFLGVSLGFGMIFLRKRQRCGNIPPVPILVVLLIFFVLWAFDGLNSYLTLYDGAPHLYEPHNLLRLTTGMLNGLVLSNLVYPVFGITAWNATQKERSIENFRELGLLLGMAGVLIAALWLGWPPLVYALSMVSVAGVVLILALINTLIALIVLRRENRATGWADLWLPATVGTLGAFMELGIIAGVRGYLTYRLGLPF